MGWIKQAATQLPYDPIRNSIQGIEFAELWHFVGRKETQDGSAKHWTELEVSYRQERKCKV